MPRARVVKARTRLEVPRLEVVQQPTGAVSGSAFTPPLAVRLRGMLGTTLPLSGETLTAALSGPGTLLGTVAVNTVDGVATFSALGVTATSPPASGFTITVSHPVYGSVATASFSVAAGGGGPTNEPAGFTPLYSQDFSAGTTPQLGVNSPWAYNGTGVIASSDPAWAGDTYYQQTIPSGLAAGDQPVINRFSSENYDGPHTSKPTYRQVYSRFRMRLPDADFQPGGVGTKLFYWGYGRVNDNDGWIVLPGNGVSGNLDTYTALPLKVYLSQGDAVSSGTDLRPGIGHDQNVTTTPLITVGAIHQIETLLDLGTVDGTNGRIRLWVDGVLVTDVSGLPLRNTADNAAGDPEYSLYGVFNMSWVPVWGSSQTKPRNDRIQFSDLYVSGSGVIAPPNLPNPQALPLAASGGGSVLPNMATVAALQSGAAAGGTYTDPYTGVTVLKLTANGTPTAGSHEHGYAEGGSHISQSWIGAGGERYSTALTGDGYLHDIRHSDMSVSNRRALTINMAGEIGAAWSMHPSTPRILFVVSNSGSPGTINRYDTSTMALANTTGWPWSPTRPGGASGGIEWFQTQRDDLWMSFQWGSPATALHARRTSDQFQRTLVIGLDEHHLDKGLPYVYGVERPTPVWNLTTGATFTASDPNDHIATDHSGTVRGALVGTGYWVGGGGAYYYRPDVDQVTWFITSDAGFHSASNDWYNVGHWVIDQPSEVLTQQWFFADRFLSDDSGAKIRRGMIAVVRLDGEVRLLAAHGSSGSNYQWYPQVNPAVDGRLVMWTSDMNGSGQYQVFVAKMPTA